LIRDLHGATPADLFLSAQTPSGEKIVAIPFKNPALVEASKGVRAARSLARTTADSDDGMVGREARWARFVRLQGQDVEALSEDDRLFVKLYPTTAEYKAHRAREERAA